MTDNDFQVSWSSWYSDQPDPRSAAHQALRDLHDTFAGDPDSPNVFTVVDRKKDQIHTVDLADVESPVNEVVTIWPRPQGTRFELTLNPTDAGYLADDDGMVTVTVRIDQDSYLAGFANMASDGIDHWDLLHSKVFSFGNPYDCSDRIIGVDGTDFLVEYTTDIDEAIKYAAEQD